MATIREKCILVRLKITEFSNQKTDPKLSRKLARLVNGSADSFESKKTLLTCPAIKKLSKLKGIIRNQIVNPLGAPYEVGLRIMPTSLSDKLEHDYAEAEQQWEDHKQELRGEVAKAIESAKRRLGDAFNPSDYPTIEEIVGKFTLDIGYTLLSDTTDFRFDNLSDDRNEKLRVNIESGVNTAINDAMATVEERLVDTVRHLGEVCNKYGHDAKGKVVGRFKDSTVTKVTELAKILPHLNLTDDPRITHAAKQLKATLATITPDGIKNSTGERSRVEREAKAIVADLGGIYG